MFEEIKDLWQKISLVIAIPLGVGFIGFSILGQICFDNLPYLLCR